MIEEMGFKTIVKIVGAAILAIVCIFMVPSLMEEVDAGEIVVVQMPLSGQLNVYSEAGWVWQGGGKATHYKKSNQFWFLSGKDQLTNGVHPEDTLNMALPAIWNDGGKSFISGSVRYDMPLTDEEIVKVHSIFGSQDAIERQLVKTNMEKSTFLSGPLMTSKESYAERRSDLISLIEDQANKGVYKTKVISEDTADPLTGEIKKENKVIILEKDLVVQRQEQSTISFYGLRLYNVSIKNIEYHPDVEKQIKTQQESIMSVQTAIANAKRAEQDVITVQKQGEADAAKAKWEIEVTKAKLVTEAESRKAVAMLDKETAELNRQKLILEGQGEAEKKRLIMAADGALDPKLKAWLQAQQYWADAFSKYTGNMVPLYSSGGYPGGNGNAGINFMELMGVKAAKDLMLDLSMKQ